MEKIDELRCLLDLHDRKIVSIVQLEGIASIPDPDTHEMTMKYVRTGDRAIIFVGPSDQLDGTLTYNDDDTATVTFTFPTKPDKVTS